MLHGDRDSPDCSMAAPNSSATGGYQGSPACSLPAECRRAELHGSRRGEKGDLGKNEGRGTGLAWSLNMGDMKTPDFDDLLAAFNIPDMVDPKAAIESGHQDEHDGQLKQQSNGGTASEDESSNSCNTHDAGVSVIVKNIQNMDTSECVGTITKKDEHFNSNPQEHAVGNGLSNGPLTTVPPVVQQTKNGWKVPRKDDYKINTQSSTLSQFSPISSAEEFDDEDKIEVVDTTDMQGGQIFFTPTAKTEDQISKCSTIDYSPKPKTKRENKSGQNRKQGQSKNGPGRPNNSSQSPSPVKNLKDKVFNPQSQDSRDAGEWPGLVDVLSIPKVKAKSSAKLYSCIAAVASISTKKSDTEEFDALDSMPPHKESEQPKEHPRASDGLQEQESDVDFTNNPLIKEPNSPSGVISESSIKGSPASNTDTIPVIPKVRIKTIKTSSGQIKRTVTRVLPEFGTEGLKKEENSQCLMTTTSTIFSSATRPFLPTTVVATSGCPSIEITKQMTIKPVATAFLPVSAVKTASSQVINLKLANNTTVKATVIPAASVQSASSAILKAANAIQQQTVLVPASSLANSKLVPKTVHLSKLSLLPQTMTSVAYDLQQVLSSSKPSQNQQSQQVKQQAGLTGHASKKVSRVQVFTNSQSSVVDAFNKVLSSLNPLPVYVPNLSPPTSACISLPSRGYKCLECGDSFALEKSLTQHYERRSVRIEVTCNHCVKSLVFYNKCSLLSHARAHKDKGVVMQCSHLILKPIPADQMISSTNLPVPSTVTGNTSASQAQVPASQIQAKITGGNQATVISAPSSAPLVAAMPLEDDASKLGRHNLKCLECNEICQDDSSLAMHYQQAPEYNNQVCVVHNAPGDK
ncbi:hypothetical protein XENOCAPTIV_002257 [Xenoophorus captivus]|uniref:C2H2-type domain-containing protein n=1 Tax=Xenoophorus captivus TaxID=1517983 RepID=A0ABV0RGA8_9TELE